MAQGFNVRGLELSGEAFPVTDQPMGSPIVVPLSISLNGTLAYQAGGAGSTTQLAWFDRSGKQLAVVGPPGNCADPELFSR